MSIDPLTETQKWKLSIAWTRVTIEGDRAVVPLDVFERLSDYSCSLPSGTYIGKRWKRHEPYVGLGSWWMGEYIDDPDSTQIGIIWRRIFFGPDLPATDENVEKVRAAAKTAVALSDALRPAS